MENQAKYTPWTWKDGPYEGDCNRLQGSDGELILEIYESHGGGKMPSALNQSLIAAAPELLEALKGLYIAIDESPFRSHFSTALIMAKKCINKAEGKV